MLAAKLKCRSVARQAAAVPLFSDGKRALGESTTNFFLICVTAKKTQPSVRISQATFLTPFADPRLISVSHDSMISTGDGRQAA